MRPEDEKPIRLLLCDRRRARRRHTLTSTSKERRLGCGSQWNGISSREPLRAAQEQPLRLWLTRREPLLRGMNSQLSTRRSPIATAPMLSAVRCIAGSFRRPVRCQSSRQWFLPVELDTKKDPHRDRHHWYVAQAWRKAPPRPERGLDMQQCAGRARRLVPWAATSDTLR